MPAGAVSVTLPPSQNVVAPLAAIVAVGPGLTVTVVGADVALQPAASVTVTVTVSVAAMTTDCVVAPFDQSHDAPLFASSVTLPPWQKVVAPFGVMVAVGLLTATFTLFVCVGQLVTKTDTDSVTGPVEPASNVIVSLVVEEVMVPLVMLHAYVALGTAGVKAVWPVELTQTVAGAVIGAPEGQPTTPTETVLELFALLESGVVEETVAVFVTVVPFAGAVTLMVMTGAVLLAASAPIVQVMVDEPLHVQPVPETEFSVRPAGRTSVTVTSFAAPAPMLLMLSVYEKALLVGTVAADAVLEMARFGAGVTVNEALLFVVPDALMIVMTPVVAPLGTRAVMLVLVVVVNDALTLLKRTVDVLKKFVPVMVTLVPTGPLPGEKLLIVGGALGLMFVVCVALLLAVFGSG